jgi:hypothetical protein
MSTVSIATASATSTAADTTLAAIVVVVVGLTISWRRRRHSVVELGSRRSSSEKHSLGRVLRVSLPRCLITKDEFVSLNEGRELWKEGQQSLEDDELGVEAANELVHQSPIGDWSVAVSQRFSQLLEMMAIVIA